MTRGLRILPAADADADNLAFHIAQDSLEAALRFYDAVDQAYRKIREHPESYPVYELHHPRLAGVRKAVVSGYSAIIFYRLDADMVEIIRVLHGARDIPQILINDMLND